MKTIYRRFFFTILSVLMALTASAGSPFEKFADDAGVSRKYISKAMLDAMGDMQISSSDMLFDATDLSVVDVIETSDPKLSSKLKGEMKKIAESHNMEVLMMQRNNEYGNEKVLYGAYDKKTRKYSRLMLFSINMGWLTKCVYIEGQIDTSILSADRF